MPTSPPPIAIAAARSKVLRAVFIVMGLLCVGLGVLGAFLPLLPTTPFLLLAAACFARSSTRLHCWLHQNRLFGEYLSRYRAGAGMPLRAKVIALILLWSSLAYSASLTLPKYGWHLILFLGLVGLGVTIHLLRLPTDKAGSK